MCGIIGSISKNSRKTIIDGLENMKYRGYDSFGLAYLDKLDIHCQKNLESPSKLSGEEFFIGIGHTRWATHGKVSLKNAHPHLSFDKRFAIVHNGVIENFQDLKEKYLENIVHNSDTDTEIIVNLISLFNKDNRIIESIRKTTDLLKGSYAFLILTNEKEIYYAVSNMPLIIGYGDGLYIASDVLAFPNDVRKVHFLSDITVGKLTKNFDFIEYKITNVCNKTKDKITLNEIKEIPEILVKLNNIINSKNLLLKPIFNFLKSKNKIIFIASGSSYNAAMIGSYFIKKHLNKEVSVYNASEFLYENKIKKAIYFFISQSGETADVLNVLSILDKTNQTVAITNVNTSSLARKTNYTIEMNAYPEIGVASTKAFISTIFILYLLTNENANINGILAGINKVIGNEDYISKLAFNLKDNKYFVFLGKGIDYLINQENILKIKELAYCHVDNYFAGELKHGPLALCDENTIVFVVNSHQKFNNIVRVNTHEVVSRNSKCFMLSGRTNSNNDFYTFATDDDQTIFECAVFFELFAVYLATFKGYNPDYPRNLAKSVTVQ